MVPYFSGTSNEQVLQNHLRGLDSNERADYLKNLTEIAAQAKGQNDDVVDAINKYFQMKSEQLELAKADRTARLLRQAYIAGATVSLLLLIASASLILVMLAIERNTRTRLA